MLLGTLVSTSDYQMPKGYRKNIFNRSIAGLRIGLKNKTKQKNQEIFIWWLLKAGLGINLQSTVGILIMSKKHPRLFPNTTYTPLLKLPWRFIWNHIPDPWGVQITNILIFLLQFIKLSYKKTKSIIPKKLLYLEHQSLQTVNECYIFPKFYRNVSISTACLFGMTKLLHISKIWKNGYLKYLSTRKTYLLEANNDLFYLFCDLFYHM